MPRRSTPEPPRAPPTVAVAIYEQVRSLIVRGRLLPGTRLTEGDVAKELNVSRTPAREALRRLQQERLLVPAGAEDGAKIRLAVAPMTASEARELYAAAGALEGVIARNVSALTVAERHALVTELTRAQGAFEREGSRRSPNWDELFELHDAFHQILVARLAGQRLRQLLDGLRPHLDRYEHLYAPLLGTGYEATFEEHRAIIDAVGKGRADAAERAVRSNWFNGAERLAEAMEHAGAAGLLQGLHTPWPGPATSQARSSRKAG